MFDINNLQVHSNVTATDLEEAINKIKQDNKLKGLGPAFLDAQNKYNINAVILASIACLESGYGTSKLASEKNNLFGIDAPLSAVNTDKYGKSFTSKSICVDHAGHRLGKQYLELDNNASWRYCNKKDIYTIGQKWCEAPGWADKVLSIAERIENNIDGGNNMKICINYGHALNGNGTGAVGLKKESEETRLVGKEVVSLLKANSKHEILVADFEGSDNYVKAVNFANSNKVDLFISIHFNSGAKDTKGDGKTTGTEVLIGHAKTTAADEAKRISDNISKLGLKNRGVKERPDLYVLKNTKMGACLVECAFLDDADDMKVYNYKTMAKAIAEGILGKSIVDSNTNTNSSPANKPSADKELWYRAVAGSFKSKELAEKRVKELADKGYSGCFIVAFEK